MERIVVGIDGSDDSKRALSWAIEEARRRDARIEAVMAWHLPYLAAPTTGAIVPIDVDGLEEARRSDLDRIIDEADTEGLHAPIERIVVNGSAARTLIDLAEGAALLVVGSRGLGGFRGLLLGSVSHQVAVHAACPTVIVPRASTS